MELELESVRRWFSRLRTMQRCASDISHDTPEDLTAFYRMKHATVLPEKEQRANFAFCVFQNTGISITDHDFTATGSFHELLDESHRQVRVAVRGLFRAIAIQNGSVGEDEDPQFFETRKTKDVYAGEEKITFVCNTLASVMPIFPQTTAGQTAFRALLRNEATIVKIAIDATVKE